MLPMFQHSECTRVRGSNYRVRARGRGAEQGEEGTKYSEWKGSGSKVE